jgi:hypothetical protein
MCFGLLEHIASIVLQIYSRKRHYMLFSIGTHLAFSVAFQICEEVVNV